MICEARKLRTSRGGARIDGEYGCATTADRGQWIKWTDLYLWGKRNMAGNNVIRATVTLDSGSFFERDSSHWDVGYFQSRDSIPDIRVYVDGEEVDVGHIKLGAGNQRIDFYHMKAGGKAPGGISVSKDLDKNLLTREKLYGRPIPLRQSAFDVIIRFHSGHFRSSMVKDRVFKECAYGCPSGGQRLIEGVAHNVIIHYVLEEGDYLKLVRDDRVLWSSQDLKVKDSLDVEIVADDSTTGKFFYLSLDLSQDKYWLPNQGNPPPAGAP
jgi:hypothetical protein